MIESVWGQSDDLSPMLKFLATGGQASSRKFRLFACGCVRRAWHLLSDARSRRAVEVAEKYADGLANGDDLEAASAKNATARKSRRGLELSACNAVAWLTQRWNHDPDRARWGSGSAARSAAEAIVLKARKARRDRTREAERMSQASLLRSIVGPLPFRPVTVAASVLDWRDGLVRLLARSAYDERLLPSGHLCSDLTAVLSDAAEEAGADSELLAHLRESGPKVRGDWVIDLLLGLE
jgi:hypothetical protein